jgi:ABC-type transport system involved in multi-copper enzyme maturation permease subunit
LSGLFASDAFVEEEEESSENTYMFDPKKDNYYFDNDSSSVNISIINEDLNYDYNKNIFSVNLKGSNAGPVEYMDIKLVYYYDIGNLDDITNIIGDFLRVPNNIQGDNINNAVIDESKIFTELDYKADDYLNWTKCANKFYSVDQSNGVRREDYDSFTFNIKLNALNALPFPIENNLLTIQFGLINFSVDQTNNVLNWNSWDLYLEFGNLNFLISNQFGLDFSQFLDSDTIQKLEQSRIYWPDQLTIFINAYDNSTINRTQEGQAIYSHPIANPRSTDNNSESAETPGHIVFIIVGFGLYFTFIIPIISLLFTSAVVVDDRDNRTITYLLSRPISKVNIFMNKYFSAYLAALFMIVPSMILTYFIMSGYKDGIDTAMDNLKIIGVLIGLTVLGLFIYSAAFTLSTSIFKYPLVLGLIYIFFFDQLMSSMPFSINRIGIRYYLTTIASSNLGSYTAFEIYEPMDPWMAGLILCVAGIVMYILANLIFTERDFH